MIANLPPLATFSVKRDMRFWNKRIVVKPEAESTPDVNKKKPSLSRLQQNQRQLRMFLEQNKSTGSGNLSEIKATSTGELPASKGADETPVTKPDGPALSTLETREEVSKQIPSPTNMGEEGTDDDIISTHDEVSSSEQESSGEGEDDSPEEETEYDNWWDTRWCNNCTKEIIGIKHHCNTCNDGNFDLCTICYKEEGHMHPMEESKTKGIPQEGEEPSTRSPNVTSTSLPLVDVASMDMTPEDTVVSIQANKAIKVPANIIENTAVTRQYVTVKRKGRRKKVVDPNSCKNM